MSWRRLTGCDWCGAAARARRVRFEGARRYLCERCTGRLDGALAGEPDQAFMLRALRRRVEQ